jgi:eukaryotic-like serine/threonine-protein kinase
LRQLVELALAKEPAARPTAQQLLDALLSGELPAAPPPRPRRRLLAAALAVVTAGAATGIWLGMDHDSEPVITPPVPPAPSAPALLTIADPLTEPGRWRTEITDTYRCEPGEDGLAISADWSPAGDATCPGPATVFAGDQSIKVTVADLSDDACATVWFRFDGKAGYQLIVCRDTVAVAMYEPSGAASTIGEKQLTLDYSARHQFRVEVAGEIATVRADGDKVLTAVVDNPALSRGRVALGLAQTDEHDAGFVRFSGIEIRGRRG